MSRRLKDPDAFERKVKPIYDALDSRNWKGSLKLCQQALQKYPDCELVKVLKAFGLERSGKRDEANQVVNDVLAATPTDEQVLRLCTMVLRAAGRLADITRMYEAAAAAVAPQGGELALVLQHEVFGAHVREKNFVKQQQVALRLSKAVAAAAAAGLPNSGVTCERYGWWVVLSILLQARAALRARVGGVVPPAGQVPPVAMEPEKLLALAGGMVARQVAKDGRLEGYEALMVYVDVLLAQGKPSDALSVVAGPLGASALRLPAERLQLRAVLSALSGDLHTAVELLREGLQLNPDDWGALLLLLDCLLPGTAATTTRAAHGPPAHMTWESPSRTLPSSSAATSSPPRFAPQHPLILISGGLAEQLPPRGVPVPPDGGCSPEAFQMAEAVLRELVEMGSRATPEGDGGNAKPMIMRGPDLAMVDLACRRHDAISRGIGKELGDAADSEAAVINAILSYYRKYGSLVSCAVDLRSYVVKLREDAAHRLMEAIQVELDTAAAMPVSDCGGGGGTAGSAALSSLRRRVCAVQIRDDLGLPRLRSCEQGVALAREMLELYHMAQPLQVGLDERERGAADELPALAAAALVTSAVLAPSDVDSVPYMLAAYGALADAVHVRPYGASMRISLAALATLLGAPGAAAAHMTKLDIKHIQMDTLASHLLLPPLLTWPYGGGREVAESSPHSASTLDVLSGPLHQEHQQLLGRALRDSRAVFEDHARDAGESLFTAYGHGMYTKVFEFTAFQERLAASLTLAVARAETALAQSLRPAATTTSSSSSSTGGGNAAAAHGSGADGVPSVQAMREAAVAAARSLPLKDLPTPGDLRYNWDLTARPAWLPPCEAGSSGAVVEWWRGRALRRFRGQGFGRCWWSATASAEGLSSEAERWRSAQASAVAHRWLLPHCIARALGAGQDQGLLGFPELVTQLRSRPFPAKDELPSALEAVKVEADGEAAGRPTQPLYGDSQASAHHKEDAGEMASVDCGTSPSTRVGEGLEGLWQLDVELYGAALAVQDFLEKWALPEAVALADVACGAVGGVADVVQALMDGARRSLEGVARRAAAWGGVLPGGTLALVSLLLREQLPVAVCCVKSWRMSLKVLHKRRAKVGMTMEGAVQRLVEAVPNFERCLTEVARACGEVLIATTSSVAASGGGDGSLGSPSGAAAVAVRFLKDQDHPTSALSATATAALEGLIREQRTTLELLAKQAAALQVALS